MSCDIHPILQYKYKGSGWLDTDIQFNMGNDYTLFGLLAGVRGTYEESLDPKGVPQDLKDNLPYEWEQYKDDYHSHSYLNYKELKEIFKVYVVKRKEEWGEGAGLPIVYRMILKSMKEYKKVGLKTRLIFCFDN